MTAPTRDRTEGRRESGEAVVDPDALHREAIVIDAVCPLLSRSIDQSLYPNPVHFARYQCGGVTAVAPTVGGLAGSAATLRSLARWLRVIDSRDDLRLVRSAVDIERCKADGRLGLIFHFQGTEPFDDDVELVEAYGALGLRVAQLTYNVKNRVGDGCEERTDAGLSRFGVELIRRLNSARIIVDCSHTGHRTTLDAMEMSDAPVIFSHANAYAVHPSARNIRDDQIKAVAATGGVIGVNGFPPFIGPSARPTLSEFIRHIDHIASLVGVEHVGLGIDYFQGQHGVATEQDAEQYHRVYTAGGAWSESYPPPPYVYPAGIETPDTLPRLTQALLAHGFSSAEVRAILGGNWLRVYRQVWNA